MSADQLDASRLRSAFPDHDIIVLEETTSTNDIVHEIASLGGGSTIVFAERQTAGRGQHGRRWESVAGKGLWFSILLEEKIDPNESANVTRWAADTIAATLNEQFSLGATVKPPNDVYACGKKVAGVLLELRAVPRASHLAVLGLGVNVNHSLTDFPPELRDSAGSIAMLAGAPVDRTALAITLIRQLDRSPSPATGDRLSAKFRTA